MPSLIPKPYQRLIRILNWISMAAAIFAGSHLFLQLKHGFAEFPWRDQWSFVKELPTYDTSAFWGTLWSVYWGHRIVLPRLIYLLDARWFAFSNGPLIAMIFVCQFFELVVLVLLNRTLLPASIRHFQVFIAAIITNLLFSSLQMENFIWGLQIEFVLVYTGMMAATVLLSLSTTSRFPRLSLACSVCAALVSSYSMANGILIWLALCWQAFLLRRPRALVLYALIGTMVISTYYLRYQQPQTGVPLSAFLLHPFRQSVMFMLFLGGPLSNESWFWSKLVGFIGLAISGAILCIVTVRRDLLGPWAAALMGMLSFLVLTTLAVGVARFDPALADRNRVLGFDVVPSRYFTTSFLFWAILLIAALWMVGERPYGRVRVATATIVALIAAQFSLARLRQEIIVGDAWAATYRTYDAIAGALIIHVPDQEYLQLLWPVEKERNDLAALLQQRQLSIFAEERAHWPGKPLSQFFTISPDSCQGEVEVREEIRGDLRLKGWLWDEQRATLPRDVIVTDPGGVIIGIGRSGIEHRTISQKVPRQAGWMAYVHPQLGGSRLAFYAVRSSSRTVCWFTSLAPPSSVTTAR